MDVMDLFRGLIHNEYPINIQQEFNKSDMTKVFCIIYYSI